VTDETRSHSGVRINDRREGRYLDTPLACPRNRERYKEGVREGARNNTVASLAGYLLWHRVDAPVVTEILLCWNRVRCQPPLVDAEVVSVVESIERLHARDDR
jgi:hypothetical protein